MGNIRGALNTQVAVGWQVNSWFTPEIRATLPLTDSQGVQYQGLADARALAERHRYGCLAGRGTFW